MAGSWLMSVVYFAFIGIVVLLLAVVSHRDMRRRKAEYRSYAGGLVGADNEGRSSGMSSGGGFIWAGNYAGSFGGWGHGGGFGAADGS